MIAALRWNTCCGFLFSLSSRFAPRRDVEHKEQEIIERERLLLGNSIIAGAVWRDERERRDEIEIVSERRAPTANQAQINHPAAFCVDTLTFASIDSTARQN